MGVIDWYVVLGNGDRLRQRDHESRREKAVGHAHMRTLRGHLAQCLELETPRHGIESNIGFAELAHDARHWPSLPLDVTCAGAAKLLARGIGTDRAQVFVVEKSMEIRGVGGVDTYFKSLQPVGIPQALEGEAVACRRSKAIEGWQRRRCRVLGA